MKLCCVLDRSMFLQYLFFKMFRNKVLLSFSIKKRFTVVLSPWGKHYWVASKGSSLETLLPALEAHKMRASFFPGRIYLDLFASRIQYVIYAALIALEFLVWRGNPAVWKCVLKIQACVSGVCMAYPGRKYCSAYFHFNDLLLGKGG